METKSKNLKKSQIHITFYSCFTSELRLDGTKENKDYNLFFDEMFLLLTVCGTATKLR